jgi:hypothetical protein
LISLIKKSCIRQRHSLASDVGKVRWICRDFEGYDDSRDNEALKGHAMRRYHIIYIEYDMLTLEGESIHLHTNTHTHHVEQYKRKDEEEQGWGVCHLICHKF